MIEFIEHDKTSTGANHGTSFFQNCTRQKKLQAAGSGQDFLNPGCLDSVTGELVMYMLSRITILSRVSLHSPKAYRPHLLGQTLAYIQKK